MKNQSIKYLNRTDVIILVCYFAVLLHITLGEARQMYKNLCIMSESYT